MNVMLVDFDTQFHVFFELVECCCSNQFEEKSLASWMSAVLRFAVLKDWSTKVWRKENARRQL